MKETQVRPILLALPLALVLAGCSASVNKAAPSSTPTPSPTVTPTLAATTPPATATPTASATPTPVPVLTRTKPAREGDVDGDGKVDAVRTTATVLTVVLSGSKATLTAPINADAPRSAPVLGSADVDRDGYAELFLETAQGASTRFATPYRYDGTVLRELQLDGGSAQLGIGGSVMHGEGFRCTAAGLLEILKAESEDGLTFTVTIDSYRLTGDTLVAAGTRNVKAKQGSAEVEAAYSVDCGSVGEGG